MISTQLDTLDMYKTILTDDQPFSIFITPDIDYLPQTALNKPEGQLSVYFNDEYLISMPINLCIELMHTIDTLELWNVKYARLAIKGLISYLRKRY